MYVWYAVCFIMEHTETEHLICVNALCRLCGERSARTKKDRHCNVKLCVDYADKLKNFFNIDVSSDISAKHSTTFCQKCYSKLIKLNRTPSNTTADRVKEQAQAINNIQWVSISFIPLPTLVCWCQYNVNSLL